MYLPKLKKDAAALPFPCVSGNMTCVKRAHNDSQNQMKKKNEINTHVRFFFENNVKHMFGILLMDF